MNASIRLLIADNQKDFTDTRAELLESENYQVLRAYSPEEARDILSTQNIHLVILDIRLINDDDEEDISGVLLAKDPEFQHIPKIILTGFPDYKTVRDVMWSRVGEMPSAIEYLAKKDGIEANVVTVACVKSRVSPRPFRRGSVAARRSCRKEGRGIARARSGSGCRHCGL